MVSWRAGERRTAIVASDPQSLNIQLTASRPCRWNQLDHPADPSLPPLPPILPSNPVPSSHVLQPPSPSIIPCLRTAMKMSHRLFAGPQTASSSPSSFILVKFHTSPATFWPSRLGFDWVLSMPLRLYRRVVSVDAKKQHHTDVHLNLRQEWPCSRCGGNAKAGNALDRCVRGGRRVASRRLARVCRC